MARLYSAAVTSALQVLQRVLGACALHLVSDAHCSATVAWRVLQRVLGACALHVFSDADCSAWPACAQLL